MSFGGFQVLFHSFNTWLSFISNHFFLGGWFRGLTKFEIAVSKSSWSIPAGLGAADPVLQNHIMIVLLLWQCSLGQVFSMVSISCFTTTNIFMVSWWCISILVCLGPLLVIHIWTQSMSVHQPPTSSERRDHSLYLLPNTDECRKAPFAIHEVSF